MEIVVTLLCVPVLSSNLHHHHPHPFLFYFYSLFIHLGNTSHAVPHSRTRTRLVHCRLDPIMDHTPAAQRRLKAIHSHLTATADDSLSDLRSNPTSAEFVSGTLSLISYLLPHIARSMILMYMN